MTIQEQLSAALILPKRSRCRSPFSRFTSTPRSSVLRKDPAWHKGRITKTLVKYPDFRVVLMVMKAQAIFQEHKLPNVQDFR